MNVLDWDTRNDTFNDGTTQEVNWHRHMTRVDLAIDYYNTNLKVGPLANKVTRTARNRGCNGINNIIDWTHGYDEQRSRAEAYAHMNNGRFETLYIMDDPEVVPNTVYNKLLEQQTNSASPYLGRSMGGPSWYRVKDLPESFVRGITTGGR